MIRFLFVRFLAAEYGLVGNTNLERAQANEVVDAVSAEAFADLWSASSQGEVSLHSFSQTMVPILLFHYLPSCLHLIHCQKKQGRV